MKPHEIPDRPWQKVGTDLFTVDNKQYLVTVDYYSRYFEVDELTSTTSNAIIRKLYAHFSRHGIPEVAISDNGPQFAAEEFAKFAQTWDFKHVTSSPGYPQSNGLAEKNNTNYQEHFQTSKRRRWQCFTEYPGVSNNSCGWTDIPLTTPHGSSAHVCFANYLQTPGT